MKFIISGGNLLSLVSIVTKAVVSKPVVQILDCIRFEVRDSMLTLTGSDTATILHARAPLEGAPEGDGDFVVPAKMLSEALRGLSAEMLSFDTDCEKYATVTWSQGQVRFPAMSTVGWPEDTGMGPDTIMIRTSATKIRTAVSLVDYATEKSDIRPSLQGLHFDFLGDRLSVVATDSHKLAIADVSRVESQRAVAVTLPKRSAGVLKQLLDGEDDVTIEVGDKYASFSFRRRDVRLFARLIAESYPAYRTVIPSSPVSTARFERSRLLDAWARIDSCTPESRRMCIAFSQGEAELSAQDLLTGASGDETVPCVFDGDPMRIAFNSTFLSEILQNLPTGSVSFALTDSSRPVVIRPLDDDDADVRVTCILVPMILDDDY